MVSKGLNVGDKVQVLDEDMKKVIANGMVMAFTQDNRSVFVEDRYYAANSRRKADVYCVPRERVQGK